MSDLISREEALAYPLSYDHYDKKNGDIKFIHGVESYREYIEGLPTVEQKHGHWIRFKDYANFEFSKCSNCDKKYALAPLLYNYCPNCGAKMDEVSE